MKLAQVKKVEEEDNIILWGEEEAKKLFLKEQEEEEVKNKIKNATIVISLVTMRGIVDLSILKKEEVVHTMEKMMNL